MTEVKPSTVSNFPVDEDIQGCVYWKVVDKKILGKVVVSEFHCGLPYVKPILDKWTLPEGTIVTFKRGCPMAKICKYREAI